VVFFCERNVCRSGKRQKLRLSLRKLESGRGLVRKSLLKPRPALPDLFMGVGG
jgi:hypothetical protein